MSPASWSTTPRSRRSRCPASSAKAAGSTLPSWTATTDSNAVFLDLAYLGRLLRPGAIVFLDDYQLPAIARAASFFLTNRGWTLEEISTAEDRHHWAVLRTSTTPDTRPFDYFVDF